MNGNVVVEFEKELGSSRQFKALQSVLPSHMDVKQFCRMAVMAVQRSPTLLDADRKSLFQSLQHCAVDGLTPDGREAALIEFRSKSKGKVVQYMPMVGGILKRVRQSGQVASITARCVYEYDKFRYWIDEQGEHLHHVPAFTSGAEPGSMRMVYAMAKLTNGEVVVEPLSMEDIAKVRRSSKAAESGPWKDWFERMAEKTALHRIARRLPCSSDIAELMDRDNWMYDKVHVDQHNQDSLAEETSTQNDISVDEALNMNDLMARIASATSLDQLKDMGMEIDQLHPDYRQDAMQAVENRRNQLGVGITDSTS